MLHPFTKPKTKQPLDIITWDSGALHFSRPPPAPFFPVPVSRVCDPPDRPSDSVALSSRLRRRLFRESRRVRPRLEVELLDDPAEGVLSLPLAPEVPAPVPLIFFFLGEPVAGTPA